MESLLKEIGLDAPILADKCIRLGTLEPHHVDRLADIASRRVRPTESDVISLGFLRDAKYARDICFCPACGSRKYTREGVPQDPHPSFTCGKCARTYHQCPVHGDNARGPSMYSMGDGTFAVERVRITCTCSKRNREVFRACHNLPKRPLESAFF